MKVKFRYKLTFEQADKLIEKYYDGRTTVEEEKRLHGFLTQANLPAKYNSEQTIFGYFNEQKNNKRFQIPTYLRWTAVIAILFIGAFSFQVFTSNNKQNYAFINGEKISDIKLIKNHALASLSEMTNSKNEIEASINNLNNNNIVKQQLQVFSEIK